MKEQGPWSKATFGSPYMCLFVKAQGQMVQIWECMQRNAQAGERMDISKHYFPASQSHAFTKYTACPAVIIKIIFGVPDKMS